MADDPWAQFADAPAPAAPSAPAATPAAADPWAQFADAPASPATPSTPAPLASPAADQQPQAADASGAIGQGLINGVPIAGPYLLAGVNRGIVAPLRALTKGESYSQALQEAQNFGKATAEQHPTANAAGEIAGGVLGTMPAVAAAPAAFGLGELALPAKIGLGAASGSAIGGADSAARGGNIASGAVLGGIVGGGAPAAGRAIGAAYRSMSGLMQPTDPALQGLSSTARGFLTKAIGDATPAELQASAGDLGPEGFMGERTPGLMQLTNSVAQNSGDGRAIVRDAFQQRMDGRNARVGAMLDQQLGPAQSPLQVSQDLRAQGSQIAAGLPQILSSAPPVDISPVVAQVGQGMNTAVGPEAAALQQARGWLMTEAVPPGGGDSVPVPISDPQTVHNAKTAFDNVINYGAPSLGIDKSAVANAQGAFRQARGGVNDALRQQVPGYADTMDQLSSLNRQRQAIEDGTEALRSGQAAVRPDDFAAQYAALSPEEQAAFRVGMRGSVDQALGTRANDFQALRNLTQGDQGWNAQKLGTAFGQDNADAINRGIAQEELLARNQNRINGNSFTSSNEADKALTQPDTKSGFLGYLANMRPLDQPATILPPFLHPQNLGERFYAGRYEAARNQVAPLLVTSGAQADALQQALLQARQRQGTLGAPAVDPLVEALMLAGQVGRQQGLGQ